MAMSKPVQDKARASSWQGQAKVKERIRQGKSKVKARLRGKFNNSNSFNVYQINFGFGLSLAIEKTIEYMTQMEEKKGKKD